MTSDVILLACSDLHLSLKPPVARSAEDSWLAAQKRVLKQISNLVAEHECPVVMAGDIFDRWSMQSELVNFAIQYLPRCYAIPGNHDLPFHSYDDIGKTSFWTLVEADRIQILSPNAPTETNVKGVPIRLYGFPCGHLLKPLDKPHDLMLEIAVVHEYIWTAKTGFTGAPKSGRLKRFKERAKGYDVVIVGDNHKGFLVGNILNCGAVQRRKADEMEYLPSVGLVYKDGSIKRHRLNTSRDKFLSPLEIGAIIEGNGDMQGFIAELNTLADADIDFGQALRHAIMESPQGVKDVVLRALEGKEK